MIGRRALGSAILSASLLSTKDEARQKEIQEEYGDRAKKVKKYQANRKQRRAQKAAERKVSVNRKENP